MLHTLKKSVLQVPRSSRRDDADVERAASAAREMRTALGALDAGLRDKINTAQRQLAAARLDTLASVSRLETHCVTDSRTAAQIADARTVVGVVKAEHEAYASACVAAQENPQLAALQVDTLHVIGWAVTKLDVVLKLVQKRDEQLSELEYYENKLNKLEAIAAKKSPKDLPATIERNESKRMQFESALNHTEAQIKLGTRKVQVAMHIIVLSAASCCAAMTNAFTSIPQSFTRTADRAQALAAPHRMDKTELETFATELATTRPTLPFSHTPSVSDANSSQGAFSFHRAPKQPDEAGVFYPTQMEGAHGSSTGSPAPFASSAQCSSGGERHFTIGASDHDSGAASSGAGIFQPFDTEKLSKKFESDASIRWNESY
mmetsp:Transcript_12061/g.32468  ORF Transcript_12061/g.32468 Transcript_12061/m.32468 type:complete len:376 (-) Transcript_12061:180-1307(-)